MAAVVSSLAVAQGPAYLMKDINHGADPDASSSPSNFVRLKNLTLFTADDGIHGCELWRTDGTVSGTQMVADVRPGAAGSCSTSFASYTPPLASDGSLAFLRTDSGDGDELWSTDGTEAGTFRVKHFGRNLYLDWLTVMDRQVFFTVLDGVNGGYGLWHSDGTEAGTVEVRHFDLPPGPLTVAAGRLFFVKTASDYPYPAELWVSDGTDFGTQRVPTPGAVAVAWLTPLSRGLLYATTSESSQLALWISDGTPAGTHVVAPLPDAAQPIAAVNDVLYFTVSAQTVGTQLWKSDGTPQGTTPVGLLPGIDQFIFNPTIAGDSIFFLAGYGQYELWKTDTAASPPTFVKAFPPDQPYGSGAGFLKGVENRLFFVASSAGYGAELWSSDGTPDGTVQVKDINPGAGGSSIGANGLTDGGVLLFAAADGTHGTELWRSDGTPTGTWLVKDINVGVSHSKPDDLTAVGDTLFFTAFDPEHGRELWSSDGTESGTTLVRDLYPGPGGAFDLDVIQSGRLSPQLRNADGRLFFLAESPGLNAEVWGRDPASGVLGLASDNIAPGPISSDPSNLTALGNRLLFIASTPNGSQQLWTTDGQGNGAFRVSDLIPYSIAANSDTAFISGISLLPGGLGSTGARLWKLGESDPIPELLGEFGNLPAGLTGVDGGAFFWVPEPYCNFPYCQPLQIWKTDGTQTGTARVTNVGNFCPGPGGNVYPSNPTDGGNGIFYFTLYDPFSGQELYVSDGSAAGTHMVADIYPGSEPQFECPLTHSSAPHELTRIGNLLYFAAYEPDHGTELWRTDGTAAGTVLVKDINPGSNSSSPSGLANVNGILLFSADDGVHGAELWGSDGSDAGTQLLSDIAPGSLPSSPAAFTVAGAHALFSADDGTHGRELWAVPLTALPPTLTPLPTPTPTPGASCAGDCSGDDVVTVDELITCVNIDLGLASLSACPACNVCDSLDCDLQITINDLMVAVNHALLGCPQPVPAATPRGSPSATPTLP